MADRELIALAARLEHEADELDHATGERTRDAPRR